MRLPVVPVDLRLEVEVGRQALRNVRIDAIELVAHGEPGGGRPAVLVLDVDADGVRRAGGEQHLDVVAEPDVLAALADVEADERRALPGVAAVDLQDDVFDPESRQPLPHRRLRVDRHVGPPFAHVRLGQHVLRLGRLARRHEDAADVRARDRQRRGDTRVVQHLDEKEARAALHQLRRRRALLDPHPALGADVHGDQHAAIEHALQRGNRRRVVAHADRVVEPLHVGSRERFPEKPQRGLEPPCLLGEGLEGNGLFGDALLGGHGRAARHEHAAEDHDDGSANDSGHNAGFYHRRSQRGTLFRGMSHDFASRQFEQPSAEFDSETGRSKCLGGESERRSRNVKFRAANVRVLVRPPGGLHSTGLSGAGAEAWKSW